MGKKPRRRVHSWIVEMKPAHILPVDFQSLQCRSVYGRVFCLNSYIDDTAKREYIIFELTSGTFYRVIPQHRFYGRAKRQIVIYRFRIIHNYTQDGGSEFKMHTPRNRLISVLWKCNRGY